LNHEFRELANVRILVADPTLAAMRDTLRFLAIPRGPNQLARPIVVLNRFGAPGSLTLKQITEGLGDTVDVRIPWLPKQLPAADFLGIPAVRTRGPFQNAIVKLSEEIMPNSDTLAAASKGRGLRRWWRK
jgi:pilus assembly protein CpaE